MAPLRAQALPSKPANDDRASATVIGALPFTDRVDNTLASADPQEPGCSGVAGGGRSIWYRLVLTAPEAVVIDSRGSDFREHDFVLWQDGDALTKISCGSATWPIRRQLAPGEYLISLDSWSRLDAGELQINVRLARRVTGAVTDDAGRPMPDVCVSAHDDRGDAAHPSLPGRTDRAGAFVVRDLEPGSYRFLISDCRSKARFEPIWYGGSTFADAALLDVPAEGPSPHISQQVDPDGSIAGTVSDRVTGAPVATCIYFREPDGSLVGSTYSYSDGTYRWFAPAPGPYVVEFGGCRSDYVTEFYPAAATFEAATPVGVAATGYVSGIGGSIELPGPAPHDNLANPITLDGPTTVHSYSRMTSGQEQGEPDCGVRRSSSVGTVWYRHTATADTMTYVRVAPAVQGLNIYTGPSAATSFSELQAHACDARTVPVPPRVLDVVAGQTYYFQVIVNWTQGGITLEEGRLGGDVAVDAPVPCTAACPYWTYATVTDTDDYEAACQPEPVTPPGSYGDIAVPVPESIDGRAPTAVMWSTASALDVDVFLCRTTPDAEGRHYVGSNLDSVGDACGTDAFCDDHGRVSVEPGADLVLRVYNWSADNPTAVRYRLTVAP